MTDGSKLPLNAHEVLQEVADLCGDQVAIALVEHFRGQRLYVPQAMKPSHEIVRALGPDQAAALSAGFGGARIAVPRSLGPEPSHTTRRHRVCELARSGLRVREIAARAECTEARVYQILAAERARTGLNPRKSTVKVVHLLRPEQGGTAPPSGSGTIVPFKGREK